MQKIWKCKVPFLSVRSFFLKDMYIFSSLFVLPLVVVLLRIYTSIFMVFVWRIFVWLGVLATAAYHDFTNSKTSPFQTGHLAMETLLSLTSKRAGDWFKEELRLLGGLDHIVDKGIVGILLWQHEKIVNCNKMFVFCHVHFLWLKIEILRVFLSSVKNKIHNSLSSNWKILVILICCRWNWK